MPLGSAVKRALGCVNTWNSGTPWSNVIVKVSSFAAFETIRVGPGDEAAPESVHEDCAAAASTRGPGEIAVLIAACEVISALLLGSGSDRAETAAPGALP
jgi:hypothetical protein